MGGVLGGVAVAAMCALTLSSVGGSLFSVEVLVSLFFCC
jgi:hypothetical protein